MPPGNPQTTIQSITNENNLPPDFTHPPRRAIQPLRRDCIIKLAKKDTIDNHSKRIHWRFTLLHFFHISLFSILVNHEFKVKTPWEVEFAAAAAASAAKRKERTGCVRNQNTAKRRKLDIGNDFGRRSASGQDFKLWEDR